MRKEYDFFKAKRLILERKESLQSASLGMHEDWFWTAQEVFKDGEFIVDLDTIKKIAGIGGSAWATPTLNLVYKDETEDMVEVSCGEHTAPLGERVATQIMCTSGPMSERVQENITPIKQIE